MSNYKLTNDDRNEFEEWWDEAHCEGDEITKLREQKEGLVLAVCALADVLSQEVL